MGEKKGWINKNLESRGIDLDTVAIVQIRSKESLNSPVTASMNCETQIGSFVVKPLSSTAVKRMCRLVFLLPPSASGSSHGRGAYSVAIRLCP